MPAPAPATWSTPTTSHLVIEPAAASAPLMPAVTSPSHPLTAVFVKKELIWMTLGSVSHLVLVPVMMMAQWCHLDRLSTRMGSRGMKIIYIYICRNNSNV